MPDTPTQTLEFVSAIPNAGEGYVLVKPCVSAEGCGLFLFVEAEEPSDTAPRKMTDSSYAIPIMNTPRRWKLISSDGERQETTDLGSHQLAYPEIDLFPDGRVLLASTRCGHNPEEGNDLNGVVVSPGTGQQHAFSMGDGIEDCMIDNAGNIWASYFDEGIYGPDSPANHGLACFNSEGRLVWAHEQSRASAIIDDCFALNVAHDATYFYFYSAYHLGRVASDGSVSTLETGLRGCHHFAINAKHVIFSSAYGDTKNTFYCLDRLGFKLGKAQPISLFRPDGAPADTGKFIGRDDCIHYFDDTGWYRATVEQICGA